MNNNENFNMLARRDDLGKRGVESFGDEEAWTLTGGQHSSGSSRAERCRRSEAPGGNGDLPARESKFNAKFASA